VPCGVTALRDCRMVASSVLNDGSLVVDDSPAFGYALPDRRATGEALPVLGGACRSASKIILSASLRQWEIPGLPNVEVRDSITLLQLVEHGRLLNNGGRKLRLPRNPPSVHLLENRPW